MPSVTVRRSIWALAAAIALAGAVFVATPYVASTRIVRDRIAAEIGAWSGYKVDIGAPPAIEVWPRLRTVLTNVTFSDRNAPAAGAIGKVERMEIELSPLAAMRGDAVFKAARLVRPSLTLRSDAKGSLTGILAGKGRIAEALERTRAALAEDPQSTGLPAQPFGSVQVTEGQVLLARDGKAEPLVTNIEANLTWPALDAGGTLAGRGEWRGEAVSVGLQSPAPLMLLAGGTAPLKVTVESVPLSAAFDGIARLDGTPFLDGKASFAAASLERLAGWTGADLGGWQALRAIALSATVLGDARRMKLDQAELQLDGDRASGAVELNFAKETPSISGSLAFERLRLDGLLAALLPLAQKPSSPSEASRHRVLLDLRLSAGQASLGGFDLSDAAATVKVQDDSAAFDILDATAFEGEFRGGLRMTGGAGGTVTEVSAAASNVNGGAFGSAMGMTLLVPNGRGLAVAGAERPGQRRRVDPADRPGPCFGAFRSRSAAALRPRRLHGSLWEGRVLPARASGGRQSRSRRCRVRRKTRRRRGRDRQGGGAVRRAKALRLRPRLVCRQRPGAHRQHRPACAGRGHGNAGSVVLRRRLVERPVHLGNDCRRRGELEQFQEKWTPVFRPELRKNKEIEHFRDSKKNGNALSRCRTVPRRSDRADACSGASEAGSAA